MKCTLEWGPALVTRGRFKGRIVNYDDEWDGKLAACYFGTLIFYGSAANIPYKHLAPVTTLDLWTRKNEIDRLLSPYRKQKRRLSDSAKLDLLHEYHYIHCVLEDRWEHVRHGHQGKGKRVFISHSSMNKQFARWLAVDLGNLGHHPWLDEWEIKVGQSIPTLIADGLTASDVVILILSPHAVQSGWVEREWQARYWDEVSSGKVVVLPVLAEKCDVPLLLRPKKYADFTVDHHRGFEDLVDALGPPPLKASGIEKLDIMIQSDGRKN